MPSLSHCLRAPLLPDPAPAYDTKRHDSLLFEQLQAIRVGDEARTAELRQRYLALILDGLHARSAPALPGPAPQWAEINRRYDA